MKIITQLPTFTGFYESIWEHSDMLYDEAYEYLRDQTKYSNHDVVEIIDQHTDWEQYRKDVCDHIVDCYEATLQYHDLARYVRFKGLYSPKTYNFATDSIEVEIAYFAKHRDKLNVLFKKHIEELADLVRNNYTSYDGFMSYHSNDIHDEEWTYWYKDEHKFLVVVVWLLELEYDEDLSDEELYYESPRISEYIDYQAVEDIIDPFKASEWICTETGNPLNEHNYFDSETIRLAKIYEKVYGEKPRVLSFEVVKDRKFPWFDELSDEDQRLFLSADKDFLEAEEIYQSKIHEV